jgi:hypothetical protein
MKYEPHGKNILKAEVTNVSAHGFWLLLGKEEKYVPFSYFPWFRDASIGEITKVEWLSTGHLYWPALDIDIAVESLDHPERFPLVSNAGKGSFREKSAKEVLQG